MHLIRIISEWFWQLSRKAEGPPIRATIPVIEHVLPRLPWSLDLPKNQKGYRGCRDVTTTHLLHHNPLVYWIHKTDAHGTVFYGSAVRQPDARRMFVVSVAWHAFHDPLAQHCTIFRTNLSHDQTHASYIQFQSSVELRYTRKTVFRTKMENYFDCLQIFRQAKPESKLSYLTVHNFSPLRLIRFPAA